MIAERYQGFVRAKIFNVMFIICSAFAYIMTEEAAYNDFALDMPPPQAESFAGHQPEPEYGAEFEEQIDPTRVLPIVVVTTEKTGPNADYSRLVESPYEIHM